MWLKTDEQWNIGMGVSLTRNSQNSQAVWRASSNSFLASSLRERVGRLAESSVANRFRVGFEPNTNADTVRRKIITASHLRSSSSRKKASDPEISLRETMRLKWHSSYISRITVSSYEQPHQHKHRLCNGWWPPLRVENRLWIVLTRKWTRCSLITCSLLRSWMAYLRGYWVYQVCWQTEWGSQLVNEAIQR